MTLEVRVPISPGPSWYNKIRLIRESICGFYPDATFTISVSPFITNDEPPNIPGVTWTDVDTNHFLRWKGTRSPYLATMMERYETPFHGDYILMLDADVICTGAFGHLFGLEGISGVMAHVPPISVVDWARLMERFGVHNFSLDCEYSGWRTMVTDPASRFGPPYFNSGVVFGPRAVFERLCQPYFEAIRFLRQQLADTYWFDQLGLALAIAKAGIPANLLPLRYNFPNQAEFDRAHPHELTNVTFLHYLRTNIIDRDRDLMDRAAMEKLIARRDLNGSNEKFRDRVAQLLPRIA